MFRQFIISAASALGVIGSGFMIEKLFLEEWPWWYFGILAGIAFTVAIVAGMWPELPESWRLAPRWRWLGGQRINRVRTVLRKRPEPHGSRMQVVLTRGTERRWILIDKMDLNTVYRWEATSPRIRRPAMNMFGGLTPEDAELLDQAGSTWQMQGR